MTKQKKSQGGCEDSGQETEDNTSTWNVQAESVLRMPRHQGAQRSETQCQPSEAYTTRALD